jgi:shikimate O-hydroxycinnamoyltransferase
MANVMDSEVVQVVESSFVVPSEPTPSEGLWLSPLDLILANRGHTPTVYLYSSSSNAVAAADGFFDVARLKEAMAKTLVAFYPLAGRLGVNNDGRAEITCTGEGALFVVAHADLTVGDIEDDFRPSPELRRLFVPRIEPASVVLAIQVSSFCFFHSMLYACTGTLVDLHCLDIDNAACMRSCAVPSA